MDLLAAWLVAFARARSAELTELPHGVVVRHPEFPLAHDHNSVLLVAPPDDVVDLVESALADAGHRRVEVHGDASAVTPGLLAAGYTLESDPVTVFRGDLPLPQQVEELDLEERVAVATAEWQRELPDAGPETWRQLGARASTAPGATFLAVRDGGRVVAHADLFVVGDVAQVEEVMTDEAHRGRGHASALVREAVRRAGVPTVFLVSDPSAVTLYEGLGFEQVGVVNVFTRPPRREAARVLLVDSRDRVLLLWHAKPGSPEHWAPPGGGLDPGETHAEAAVRELREETGLTGVELGRPTWSWTHVFARSGVPTEQHELLFVTRARPVEGTATHVETDGIADARWFTAGEIAALTDEVWPYGLAELLPAALVDHEPEQPLVVGAQTSTVVPGTSRS